MRSKRTVKVRRARIQPKADEVVFQTRRLKRALHARLHVLKAIRNGQRTPKQKPVHLDEVLNEALAVGLAVLEQPDTCLSLAEAEQREQRRKDRLCTLD